MEVMYWVDFLYWSVNIDWLFAWFSGKRVFFYGLVGGLCLLFHFCFFFVSLWLL